MARSPSIVARDVVKCYGDTVALRGASLEAEPGWILGLVGPNGAGKTTLLRVLAGVLPLDRGLVRVLGKDPWGEREELGSLIGYAPERAELPGEIRGRDLLRYFARLRRCGAFELRRILRLLRLDDPALLSKRYEELSAGYRKRLLLAIALMGRPKVLLLDEPTLNIDPATRGRLARFLESLRREGCTIVLASHNLFELEAVCTHVAFIKDGLIVAQGEVEELLRKHGLPVRVVAARVNGLARLLEHFGEGVLHYEFADDRVLIEVSFPAKEAFLRYLAENKVPVFEVKDPSLSELYERVVGA